MKIRGKKAYKKMRERQGETVKFLLNDWEDENNTRERDDAVTCVSSTTTRFESVCLFCRDFKFCGNLVTPNFS